VKIDPVRAFPSSWPPFLLPTESNFPFDVTTYRHLARFAASEITGSKPRHFGMKTNLQELQIKSIGIVGSRFESCLRPFRLMKRFMITTSQS